MKLTPSIRTFTPAATMVAFPLGGIGTGNVSLGARGELRDWEIFNRPAKNTTLPNSFFTLWAKPEGGEAITRVLEGPIQPPYHQSHGFAPDTGAGLPRFANCTFHGEYPLAQVELSDPRVPVNVTLEAFTPLVPLNAEDSGLPCAVFAFTLTNTTSQPLDITLVGSMMNPVGHWLFDPTDKKRDKQIGHSVNEYRESGNYRGLAFSATDIEPGALEYGNVSLVTDHPNVSHKRHWRRGMWWDFLREFWDDLHDDGRLTDLGYEGLHNYPETASLGLHDTLPAGASQTYRFILTWYFPNRVNSWDIKSPRITRNQYATRFASADNVAAYVMRELPRLTQATHAFHDALFDSTLPPSVIDALSANIVPVRSNTCFWLEDGNFYGWEGCFDNAGCCGGNCTHVWSYVYTVAYLFPSLERAMRSVEFEIETEPDGYMSFRIMRPFEESWTWHGEKIAAVDGQMGSILRAYREYLLSGDREWLLKLWPGIKNTINYAGIQWDLDGDFVLDGRQHNTYDIEFHGPNPLCSAYYLAALRAVEEMARIFGESDLAERCHRAFEKGSAKFDALLWNGEYYQQVIEDIDAYPYQYGAGCLSDQLLGALHAQVLGLGDILPAEHMRSAVKAIFTHNFRRDFSEHVNVQRTFVLNGESGLILCSWPQEGRPRFPFVYSDEVWTGIEYHVAAHLIYTGALPEAFTIIDSLRERHDGIRRNPWNEVECGSHYARSMSSWMLLLALSGAQADAGKNELRFAPVALDTDEFRTFWSSGRAWGNYTQTRDANGVWTPAIEVLGGDATGLKVIACEQEWTL